MGFVPSVRCFFCGLPQKQLQFFFFRNSERRDRGFDESRSQLFQHHSSLSSAAPNDDPRPIGEACRLQHLRGNQPQHNLHTDITRELSQYDRCFRYLLRNRDYVSIQLHGGRLYLLRKHGYLLRRQQRDHLRDQCGFGGLPRRTDKSGIIEHDDYRQRNQRALVVDRNFRHSNGNHFQRQRLRTAFLGDRSAVEDYLGRSIF